MMNRFLPSRTSVLALLASLCLYSTALGWTQDSEKDGPFVIITSIRGPLTESMVATIDRAIAKAERTGAEAIIVEIDTPGGEVTIMELIAQRLGQSEVVPIAHILNEAVSAGAYIAMACERIYTYEHAQIGSSYPIVVDPLAGLPDANIDPNIMEKQLSYLRAKFRDRAQTHDRPGMAALAEAMVDPKVEVVLVARGSNEIPMTQSDLDDILRRDGPGAARVIRTIAAKGELLNLTAEEAFDLGFTDGIAISRDEVLEAEGLTDARLIHVYPSWSEKMVGALEHIQWLLLIAGLVLLYVEFKVPGFGIAGALGIVCLGLLLLRNYLVGLAEIPEILLVILGIVLLAVEVFVIPGFGAAGIAGLACVALGALFSFLPFLIPEGPVQSELLWETIQNFSLSLIATVIALIILSRYVLPRTSIFNRLVLDTGRSSDSLGGSAVSLTPQNQGDIASPGARGRAFSDLRPAGKVDVNDNLLDAISEGDYISRGEEVIVTRVEGNHLVVRTARGGDRKS